MSNREYVKYQGIKFYRHPFSEEYLASKCGKILSLKWNKKRILKLNKRRDGYLHFYSYENNKRRNYLIHRFVYECFKGAIPEGMHIDHFDFNRKNNAISNLQLLTPKENVRKSNCKKVLSLNIESGKEKIFRSVTETAKFYQISISTVCENCQKKIEITQSKRDGERYKFSYFKN